MPPRFPFSQEVLIPRAAGNVAGRWPLLVSSFCGLPYLKRATSPKVCLLKVGQHRDIKVWSLAPNWNYCKGSASFRAPHGLGCSPHCDRVMAQFLSLPSCVFRSFRPQGRSLIKLLHGHLHVSVYFLGGLSLQLLLLGSVLGVFY